MHDCTTHAVAVRRDSSSIIGIDWRQCTDSVIESATHNPFCPCRIHQNGIFSAALGRCRPRPCLDGSSRSTLNVWTMLMNRCNTFVCRAHRLYAGSHWSSLVHHSNLQILRESGTACYRGILSIDRIECMTFRVVDASFAELKNVSPALCDQYMTTSRLPSS